MDLLRGSLSGLLRALESGAVSSVEVTQALLAQAQRVQPLTNAFVRIDADGALAAAHAADAARRAARSGQAGLPPLLGVPMAHKDMFFRAGRRSGGGSRILGDVLPGTTATVLERLDAAGAFEYGVLHMAEFAYGNTGHNAHLGHCRNPWNPDHITGGSSSGSGASVAACANFAALGSDTGGSIRHPAAFNGVVGIKTSVGAVSRAGAMPLAGSLDTVGFLARTVADCALLFGLVAGADPRDVTTLAWPQQRWRWSPLERLDGVRIGVDEAFGHAQCTPEVAAAMQESLAALRARGATLVPVTVPWTDALFAASMLVLQAEALAVHKRWLRERPGDYSDQVRGRLEPGLAIAAHEYLDALRARGPALAAMDEAVFAHCDALHAPVVTMSVPRIDETDVGGGPRMLELIAGLGRWTRPVNYLGLPALTMPAGSARGLPVGFQLVGPKFSEARLFSIGAAYEAERGFAHWHPRLAAAN